LIPCELHRFEAGSEASVIIFGFGRRTRKDRGAVIPLMCPRCNNHTTYRWVSTSTWFTLFFVPVVPYSSKHYLVCPVCSNGRELTRAQAQHAATMVEHTRAVLSGAMPNDVYGSHANAFWGNLTGSPPAAELPAARSGPLGPSAN
jgi:zinc-ribbon family